MRASDFGVRCANPTDAEPTRLGGCPNAPLVAPQLARDHWLAGGWAVARALSAASAGIGAEYRAAMTRMS